MGPVFSSRFISSHFHELGKGHSGELAHPSLCSESLSWPWPYQKPSRFGFIKWASLPTDLASPGWARSWPYRKGWHEWKIMSFASVYSRGQNSDMTHNYRWHFITGYSLLFWTHLMIYFPSFSTFPDFFFLIIWDLCPPLYPFSSGKLPHILVPDWLWNRSNNTVYVRETLNILTFRINELIVPAKTYWTGRTFIRERGERGHSHGHWTLKLCKGLK